MSAGLQNPPQTPAESPAPGRASSRWPDRTINEVFQDAAARHADRVAIHADGLEMTFAELRTRVARIALAVPRAESPEQPRIALLLGQGADAVAAVFAALQAGCVYIPLDPGDPPARIEFILRDSSAAAILTDSANLDLARRLAAGSRTVVNIDDAPAAEDNAAPASALSPASTAYLFYTSGSTGQPKGVMQTHRNLLHFAGVYGSTLGIAPGDRCSLLYTLSFSAANMDIYGTLLNGATLCPFDVRRLGAAGLAAWIAGRRITVLHTVPTLFRHLTESLFGGFRFETVRAVDLGGEPVFAGDVKLWRERFPESSIFVNHLAATEASVIAQYIARPGDAEKDGLLPAGPPAPGIEIRIAREDGSDAPPGGHGEIIIHSPFLSPGYWGRPAQTTLAFKDDPARPDWRIYRSGDRGWLDAEGLLHAAGRTDSRIKVRGHSVDLAEVEAALRGIGGVRDAVVVPVSPRPGDPPVPVAYLATASRETAAFRRALAALLPDYMIPAEFNLLDDLPRNATGKIDRRLLSGPDRPRVAGARNLDPPANPVEESVAAAYVKVLGLDEVGRNEDFFELGGTSLKASELQVELRRSFGCDAPLGELLRDATVAGVAAVMGRLRESRPSHPASSPVIVPLRESGSARPLFLVHGALGQAFISPAFLKAVGENQPLYGFQARGADGAAEPHRNIPEMAADYIAAMRQIQPDGPWFIGSICAGGIVAQEMARQLAGTGLTCAPLLLIDPPAPPGELPWMKRMLRILGLRFPRLPFVSRMDHVDTREIGRTLKKRGRQNRIGLDPNDRKMRKAAVRAAVAFQIALLRHKPRPCPGAVFVLASRTRLQNEWTSKAWAGRFSGTLKLFEVGDSHHDVLDPGNERFASQLRACIEAAHAALQP